MKEKTHLENLKEFYRTNIHKGKEYMKDREEGCDEGCHASLEDIEEWYRAGHHYVQKQRTIIKQIKEIIKKGLI